MGAGDDEPEATTAIATTPAPSTEVAAREAGAITAPDHAPSGTAEDLKRAAASALALLPNPVALAGLVKAFFSVLPGGDVDADAAKAQKAVDAEGAGGEGDAEAKGAENGDDAGHSDDTGAK